MISADSCDEEDKGTDAFASTQLDHLHVINSQHVNISPAALPTGLRDSPLGRLPPEIRNIIYTMTLSQTHDISCIRDSWSSLHNSTKVSQALNLTATCKQVRAETQLMFFTLNHINVYAAYTHEHPRHCWPRLEKSVALLNKIPTALIPSSARVVIWLEANTDPFETPPFFNVARKIRHFQLFFGVLEYDHHWGSHSGASEHVAYKSGVQQPSQKAVMDKRPLCRRAPDSMIDCARLKFIFPSGDRKTALENVEDIYRSKVDLIEAHRSHTLCPVRCELEKLLASFVVVRQRLTDLVEQICV